jgi:hypothetical protein
LWLTEDVDGERRNRDHFGFMAGAGAAGGAAAAGGSAAFGADAASAGLAGKGASAVFGSSCTLTGAPPAIGEKASPTTPPRMTIGIVFGPSLFVSVPIAATFSVATAGSPNAMTDGEMISIWPGSAIGGCAGSGIAAATVTSGVAVCPTAIIDGPSLSVMAGSTTSDEAPAPPVHRAPTTSNADITRIRLPAIPKRSFGLALRAFRPLSAKANILGIKNVMTARHLPV